jgi:hypothetical protein
MIEKEKRKPELPASWFRTTGCLLMLIGVGIWAATPFIHYDIPAQAFIPILCGAYTLVLGAALFKIYRQWGKPRYTLNQIRQSPDNPLIVQQWNGREWIDTLDMRSAVKDAQQRDLSQL